MYTDEHRWENERERSAMSATETVRLQPACDGAHSLHRLVRRGEITVPLFDGDATITAGTPVEVARYCCDSPVGNAGVVHGWRQTPRGIKVVVDYGLNAGGQRLLKPYPANVLRVAPNTELTGDKSGQTSGSGSEDS